MNSPVLRYEVPTGRAPQPVLLVAKAAEGFHWGLEGHHEPGADMYLSTHLRVPSKSLVSGAEALVEAMKFAGVLGLVKMADIPALRDWWKALDPDADFAAGVQR